MTRTSRERPRWCRARAGLAVVASLLLALAACEVVLRLAGVAPRAPAVSIGREPVVHEPDGVLGWHTIPGAYVLPPYVSGGASAAVTIRSDGARATSSEPPARARRVELVGCSFTFGWAVGDDATWAWHLQQRRPELAVVNHGVNAYGTYQSLLLLEQALARGDRPERVIYGFHEVHEERNVAAPRWLAMLDRLSHRGNVAVPYATLDASGALERHPPERYPAWPLRDRLATVAFLEDLYAERAGAARVAEGRKVTERLLLEMRDLCARHGVTFDVVLLQASPGVRRHYAKFLGRNGIPFADCVVPITPQLRVPGEGHPNGVLHRQWAECVDARVLREPGQAAAAAAPPSTSFTHSSENASRGAR